MSKYKRKQHKKMNTLGVDLVKYVSLNKIIREHGGHCLFTFVS